MKNMQKISTGLKGLDEILDSLRMGDNVVWNADSISDYKLFVTPLVQSALKENIKIIYIRFGKHEKLIESDDRINVIEVDAYGGFETFTTKIHGIITTEGEGAFYIFDCLTDLLSAWSTDSMIGYFFKVTCPYLYQLKTIAYFSFIRGSLSVKTISRIRETTQLLINIYYFRHLIYVHPLKVWKRNSPTMFLPHILKEDKFIPVANSIDATNLLNKFFKKGPGKTERQLDYWDRIFLEAENIAEKKENTRKLNRTLDQLTRILIGKEERILSLARKFFSIEDLLDIKSRMIGTGFIGGKAAGMLLSRKILLHDTSFDWNRNLEKHDSFFVGSDVYYSFIVHNGWWDLYMRHKSPPGYFRYGKILRKKMLSGSFPLEIKEKLQQVLEYFGQYPIIVRSSSLLEDSFTSAFAGKYDSFFCVNQGTPEERYVKFAEAVTKIFASSLSEDALSYREQRNLDTKEEQMALLIQRVSGSYKDHLYYPEMAGVGVSFNTFVWSQHLDPKAGMLRLVLGLGTRAVDRLATDSARIIALDAPLMKPEINVSDKTFFSQKDLDLLDIKENNFKAFPIHQLHREFNVSLEKYGSVLLKDPNKNEKILYVTFDKLLMETNFPKLMQRMLKSLEEAYQYPVDIEFTVNSSIDGSFKISLVQCRPLQTKGLGSKIELPKNLMKNRIFFQSEGNFTGGSISQEIRRIIRVVPDRYISLAKEKKQQVARMIGTLNKKIKSKKEEPTMLIGPGRWGTSTPTLGVPVSFSEINKICVLIEMAFEGDSLMPELSFGSHFFQDLIETDIFYLALFPESDNCFFNRKWLAQFEQNPLPETGNNEILESVIKVYELPMDRVFLMSDIVSQKILCFETK